MIDPARLLEGDGDDFERALLRSALGDSGSRVARARALAVFAGAGLHLAASTSAAKATAATAQANFAAASMSVPKLTASTLLKWIGSGVVAGTVSAAGVHAAVDASGAPPRGMREPVAVRRTALTPPPSVAGTGLPAVVESPKVVTSASEPKVRHAELQARGTGADAAGPSNVAFPAESSNPRLRDELLALESVRQALRSGDAAAALSGLGRYESRFPGGALSREATVLAVEARLAAGDPQGARAVAARARATDSTSPHAKKIEALLSTRRNP
jgi:hypothetical protein